MKRRAFSLGLAAAAAASVAEARPVRVGRYATIPFGVSNRHPWPTEGGGRHRAFRSSRRVPFRAPTSRTLVSVGGATRTDMTVLQSGHVLLVQRARLLAYRADGEADWNAEIRGGGSQPSVLPDGSLMLVTRGGVLRRVRSGTSAELSARTTAFGCPLVLDDGSCVLMGSDGRLLRFDGNGLLLFSQRFATARPIPSVATDGRLLVAAAGNRVYWFDFDGTPRAQVELPAPVVLGPSLAPDGSVWIVDGSLGVHALRPGQTVSRGSLAQGERPAGLAVARDGSLRVSLGRGGLLGLDGEGQPLFSFTDAGPISGRLIVGADGTTLCTNVGGELLAVDASGELRWRIGLGSRVMTAPILGDAGRIYAYTTRGELQVWREE
ncbi:MAG: PQQ-binding-like beta-propeller repeat protein [Myxococcota bacterium]